jgi:hypothetical protein
LQQSTARAFEKTKAKKKGREKREGEKARGRFLEAEERMNI